MTITAWDQRTCPRCRRTRVHYRTTTAAKWQCIGTLPTVADIVVPCGKRRINFPQLRQQPEQEQQP